MTAYDAIVIGAGVVGGAATHHLARDGYDVLALERYGIPNAMATSAGVSRIFRFAYHEGDRYVPLLRRAYEQWAALQAHRDGRLLRVTGSLTIGPPDSDTFETARDTCKTYDIDHEELTADEVNHRFPAYNLPATLRAVWQPNGGLLDPERCLVALIEEAQAQGADIHGYEAVTDWDADGTIAHVQTERREYTADAIVIAAGAWAADHTSILEELLTLERHVSCRFQPTNPDAFTPDNFPVFVIDTANGDHFYGLPTHRLPGFKIGGTNTEQTGVDPDGMNRQPSITEERPARTFVEQYLPAGAGPTMDLSACILSHSPDGDYIIDRLPDRSNAIVAAGLSGHGFKTAPAIGEMAAALATGDSSPYDTAPFALSRFDTA